MRILIAEEALQTGEGHWPGYIGGLAAGFRNRGDHVDVLVHKEATARVIKDVGGKPCFSRNCWRDPESQGGLGGLRHNFVFKKELSNRIEKEDSPYDWICALTMRLQHLLAFALMSRDKRIAKDSRFLLLFVQGFGIYREDGKIYFPNNSSTLLARICFRLLARSVRSGRVVLAAETRGMQQELNRFTGLPVELFPHPVFGVNELVEESDPFAGTETRSEQIVLTCPGIARHEKGSDLLHDAIVELLADPGLQHLNYIMQWPEAFGMPDGSVKSPSNNLLSSRQVRFRNEILDTKAYEKMLLESDAILLPYRRASYHNRVSRVAIEAAGQGIPLIYMSGTWSEEVAEKVGCGIPISGESHQELVSAIQEAVNSLTALKRQALSGKDIIRKYHSTETFREKLKELQAI